MLRHGLLRPNKLLRGRRRFFRAKSERAFYVQAHADEPAPPLCRETAVARRTQKNRVWLAKAVKSRVALARTAELVGGGALGE